MQKPNEKESLIANNPKAYHDFFIEETLEAGLALAGTEVKSLRDKKANLQDSFARFDTSRRNRQATTAPPALFLYNAYIAPYTHGNIFNHEPRRKRRLLVKKHELWKLFGKLQLKGLTLIPVRLYFNERGFAKVALAVARGKKLYDKRAALAKKSANREIERVMKPR